MTNPLSELTVRDWIQVGTVVVAITASHVGLRGQLGLLESKVETVNQQMAVIDGRLWQLQGGRQRTTLLDVEPCPADATRVVVR